MKTSFMGPSPSPVMLNTLGNHTEPLPLSVDLLNEVWKLIFSMEIQSLLNCSLVDRKWNQLTNDPILIKNRIYEKFCMTPLHWNKFCGPDTVSDDEIVKAYASFPKDFVEILKSDCPAFAGKKVIDTHMLVWIPETIKGEPLTIDNFGTLLKEQPELSRNSTGYQCIESSVVQ